MGEFAARFREAPQLFPPGSTFNYEHSEHVILGEALRRIFAKDRRSWRMRHYCHPPGCGCMMAVGQDTGISSHAYSPRAESYVATKLPPFGPFWRRPCPP